MARMFPTDEATIARFWTHTERRGECLIWTASVNPGGYGQFNTGRANGRELVTLAHRYAYLITKGALRKGQCVCHRCDCRPCVEPAHLFAGSRTDNNQDMFNKGRGFKFDGSHVLGERNPNTKTTLEEVRLLRRLYAEGVKSSALGRQFGVSRNTVWNIVTGRTWAKFLTAEEADRVKAGVPQFGEQQRSGA